MEGNIRAEQFLKDVMAVNVQPLKGLVMKFAVISFTRRGEGVCEKLANAMKAAGMECCGYTGRKTGNRDAALQTISGSLSEWTRQQFTACDGLIFIGAAGIAVRLIAPYLKDKLTDPAVVVVDEAEQFAISLLSGHVGGANRLAEWTAEILNAAPVITTASDVRGRNAIDVWAADYGFVLTDRKLAKEIAAALLEGEQVGFFSDASVETPENSGYEAGVVHRLNIWVTCRAQPEPDVLALMLSKKSEARQLSESELPRQDMKFLRLVPKTLVLGIGCRRDTPEEKIETAVRETLAEHNLDIRGVSAIASIDLKKDEAGLMETAAGLAVPFFTYSSEELVAVQGDFTESGFVCQVTGVGNVCERSALCCAGAGGRLIVKKQVHTGVTVAVAEKAFAACMGKKPAGPELVQNAGRREQQAESEGGV